MVEAFGEFFNGLDGGDLDVKAVESEFEDFEAGDFEEEEEGVCQDSIEHFSEFFGGGDFLFAQEFDEVADDVLEFDLDGVPFFVEHLIEINGVPFLKEGLELV